MNRIILLATALLWGIMLINGSAVESKSAVFAEKNEKPMISINPLAEVAGGMITLKDIATLENVDEKTLALCNEVSFGNAPLFGSNKTLFKNSIIFTLKQNGITEDNFEISCPPKTTIKRSSTQIDREVLIQKIKRQIIDGSPYPPESLVVDLNNISPDLSIPEGDVEYEIKINSSNKTLGKIPVQVNVLVNNSIVRRIACNADIDLKLVVPRASKNIPRGAAVSANDFEIVETMYSKLPSRALTDFRDLENVVANKNIMIGEFFSDMSVTRPFIINSGQPVLVKVYSGNMVITAKGIATQRGRKGDMIKIVNPTSNKNFLGYVEDAGIVKVVY